MARGTKRKASSAAEPTTENGAAEQVSTKELSSTTEQPSKKADKKGKQQLFKAPEAAEVLEIAKTRNLYKSNLFRLQLEELLKELSPKAIPRLETILKSLRSVLLEKLKSREIQADFAAEFPELQFHQRGGPSPSPLSFAPPTRVDVVGSFLLNTSLKDSLEVDLSLEMPRELFRSKDYLNFRYHDKRTAYVGEVRRQLSNGLLKGVEELSGLDVEFEALQGDCMRPCVAIRLRRDNVDSSDDQWTVRLLPTYSSELWPERMLSPERNAVRPEKSGAAEDAESATGTPVPTALYNSLVLEDCRMRVHLEMLHKAMSQFPAMRDAVMLLKRWALASGFLAQASAGRRVFTPMNGFTLSLLAAHAGLTSNVAPAQTSSFQLFKLALSMLVSTDWASQKVVFGKEGTATLSAAEAQACSAHFYDADGLVNVFWRLAPLIDEVRWEAQRALKILDAVADPFEDVFGRRVQPELVWDLVVRTPQLGARALCPDLFTGSASGSTSVVASSRLPADSPEAFAWCQRLRSVLLAGLNDRCLRVSIRLVGEPSMRWRSKVPAAGVAVMVGLVLDPTNLDRALDRGPSSQDQVAAEQFRALWGANKSELRRFKDGSILECVVWSKPPPARSVESRKQPAVVTQIVRHLLAQHLPKPLAQDTDVVTGPLGMVANLGDRERRLWATFETFRTHLAQLSSLPLTIKDIHPVDASFSYMDPLPTLAPPAASGSDGGLRRNLHHVVVEFEASGRWPDDPTAAQKVAGALLLQIREELGSDLGIEADATETFLDVRYPEAVFRLQVFHPHELRETANKVTNLRPPAGGSPPSEQAVARLRELWWRPRLRGSLRGHVLQLPAMAGAARLCKRWMASQMLSGYDDFVEHLVAYVFLHPAPFEAPTSPQVAFCRFCWLLENFDWQREPLVLDLDGKLTEEERMSLRESFERQQGAQKATSSLGLWVVTRFDPHAMLLRSPTATLVTWLRRRAQQAMEVFRKRLLGGSTASDWRMVFQLDTSAFDLCLRLLPLPDDPHEVPVEGSAASSNKKKKGADKLAAAQLVSREAAQKLVQSLRKQLSPVCLVLHDEQNQLLGIKWRPSAFMPQAPNVLMGSTPYTVVAHNGGDSKAPLIVPNVLCLISNVAALAQGLALEAQVLGSG